MLTTKKILPGEPLAGFYYFFNTEKLFFNTFKLKTLSLKKGCREAKEWTCKTSGAPHGELVQNLKGAARLQLTLRGLNKNYNIGQSLYTVELIPGPGAKGSNLFILES